MISLEVRLILAALASFRLTQIVVFDEGPWSIFQNFRVRVGVYDLARNGEPATLWGRLFACPYCVGVYVSAFCAVCVLFPGIVGDVLLVVFGIMGAQAFLQAMTGKR